MVEPNYCHHGPDAIYGNPLSAMTADCEEEITFSVQFDNNLKRRATGIQLDIGRARGSRHSVARAGADHSQQPDRSGETESF